MKQLFIKNKNFRFFWIASCISTIGDFVDDIAFAQLVYFVTKSTLLTSYVFAIKVVFTFLSTLTAVRRHIVGGENRTLISVKIPLRLCRIGTCRRLKTG